MVVLSNDEDRAVSGIPFCRTLIEWGLYSRLASGFGPLSNCVSGPLIGSAVRHTEGILSPLSSQHCGLTCYMVIDAGAPLIACGCEVCVGSSCPGSGTCVPWQHMDQPRVLSVNSLGVASLFMTRIDHGAISRAQPSYGLMEFCHDVAAYCQYVEAIGNDTNLVLVSLGLARASNVFLLTVYAERRTRSLSGLPLSNTVLVSKLVGCIDSSCCDGSESGRLLVIGEFEFEKLWPIWVISV